MYQVSFKFKAPFREPYYDCVFYDSEEEAIDYSNFLKAFDNYSDVNITSYAIDNLVDANQEIVRLRKLLSNAYTELQQLKKGYNEFIQGR